MNNPSKGTFLGHPKGLFLLFSTELWERFSYYGMRAVLVLYLTDMTANGGMGGWHQQCTTQQQTRKRQRNTQRQLHQVGTPGNTGWGL